MDEPLFTSTGILHYADDPLKVFVEVDPEIVRYARARIPKWIQTRPQAYPAHISVVRKEVPPLMGQLPRAQEPGFPRPTGYEWKRHEGEEIEFQYSHVIYSGTVYYWLRAYSSRLEQIRVGLGLTPHSNITRPPDETPCYHITISNLKGL